jgi:hypothetical protein
MSGDDATTSVCWLFEKPRRCYTALSNAPCDMHMPATPLPLRRHAHASFLSH